MMYSQVPPGNHSTLLAVICAKNPYQSFPSNGKPKYPFPALESAGRLEVQILANPTIAEFNRTLHALDPSIVYLQGEQLKDSEEVGSFRWGDGELSNLDALFEAFGSLLPATVYIEIPNGETLAHILHSKGVPYVIYWKETVSCYAAAHFRHAFFSVMQSSSSHTCDAFRLAHASFRLYCVDNNKTCASDPQKDSCKGEPCLIGEPPKIDISSLEVEAQDEESSGVLPAIKIYDDDVSMRFLVCGRPYSMDACLLEALEDGLGALLNIEIRGSKLHNRTSAPPPPLQAGTFSRGVVTMRCDLSTCSAAHVSLLVSGSADTCFNDYLLENHIRNEIIVKSKLVNSVTSSDDVKLTSTIPRKSTAIACGSSAFEVSLKVPTWASQVLRQLAPDVSYRSLVMLGIASIQGLSVASFENEDAKRILFFCPCDEKIEHESLIGPPSWLLPPAPSRKKIELCEAVKSFDSSGRESGISKRKANTAAVRPIPHTQCRKILRFSSFSEAERYEVDQPKSALPVLPTKHAGAGTAPIPHRKALSSSFQAQQIIALNPLPLKKHGCGRAPIQACSEEDFLRDVMQFLVLRGHNRLVPQGGLAEFPDAILNAKRLDLFNLYREVVSRGGFHVGNGINWKGQVFSKMRNHTLTNRMTGVGNTLKRHYETYLLEYELAHDDVDGECCLLCHSSAAGDWVNCGICGEWAHFGCDRRQGLGAFKDYAKTDGLEYICPHCSGSNFKKKSQKTSNGF